MNAADKVYGEKKDDIGGFIEKISMVTMKLSNPNVLASYYIGMEEHTCPKKMFCRFSEAENIYKNMLNNNIKEDDKWALLGLSYIEIKNGNYNKAAEDCMECLELDNDFYGCLVNYATALSKMGNDEEAIVWFKKAVNINQSPIIAYLGWANSLKNLGEHYKALEKYKSAFKVDRYNHTLLVNWVNHLIELKRYGEAEWLIRQAVKSNVNTGEFYYLLGLLAAEKGRPDIAANKYSLAERRLFRDPELYFNWGNSLARLRDYKNGISKYEKAIELKPDWAAPYYNNAVLLEIIDDVDNAINNLLLSISYDNNHFMAYLKLGVILSRLKKFEKAIENFNQAIMIDRDNSEAYRYLGEALINQAKVEGNAINLRAAHKRARELFRKALDLDPRNSFACIDLRESYLESGLIEGADKAIMECGS